MSRQWRIGIVCLAGLLALGGGPASSENHSIPDSSERIRDAIRVLTHVPSGRSLITRAQDHWAMQDESELLRVFKWGTVSRTDAVLTRHFNPHTGKEIRERKVTIFLRKGQSLEDLVLDIAHELTHAIAGPSWDPYDPDLTASKYIWNAIEGDGGEVDALIAECQVGIELSIGYGLSASRCQRYRASGKPQIEKEKVRRDFYRVGSWKRDIADRLGTDGERFPLLSSEKPQLYSSTGHAPYPVALLREFEEITEIACENSRKRLSTLPGRILASATSSKSSLADFLSRRCDKAASQSQ